MAIRGKTNESLEKKMMANRLNSDAKKDSSLLGHLNRIFAKVQTQVHNVRPEKKNIFDLDSDEKQAKTIEDNENENNQEEFKSLNNDSDNQNFNNYDDYNNNYYEEENKRLEEEAKRIQEENLKNVEENWTDNSKMPVGNGTGMQSAATIGLGLGIKAHNMVKSVANYDLTKIGSDAMSKAFNNEINEFEKQREIDKLNSYNNKVNSAKDEGFKSTIGTRSANQAVLDNGSIDFDKASRGLAKEMAEQNGAVVNKRAFTDTVEGSKEQKHSIRKDNPYKNAAAKAAKSVGKVTVNGVKGVWNDISEKSESEFAEDEAKFKDKAKGVVKTETDFAKIVYARKLIGGNALADVDDALGTGTTWRNKASEIKNYRDILDKNGNLKERGLEGFKKDYIAEGVKKFDVDISALNGKEKAEFLKKYGEKGQAFLNGWEKINKADKVWSGAGAHSAADLAKGTAKMVGGAVIVTDGEFFQGLNAKNDPFISTAVGIARTSGSIAKQGLKKLEKARQEGMRVAANGEKDVAMKGKLQNKFYELGKEQGSGVKKTYDTSGNFFKKSVNNTRKRFHDSIDKLTRFGEKGIKTGTHVANATANGAAAGTGTAVATGTGTAAATGTGAAAATGTGAAVAGGTAAGVGTTVATGYTTVAVADAWNPVGWVMLIVELIIILIIFCCLCTLLCASTGVNDIFSNGSPFSVDSTGNFCEDPNDSYVADTVVYLDAYLTRNFENICRRGIENQVIYSQGGDANITDFAAMSITEDFKIDFTSQSGWGWDNKFDYSTSEANSSSDETLKASAQAYSGDSSLGEIQYNAGKVCVLQHIGPEVISNTGVDMSTASRYQIKAISGFDVEGYYPSPISNNDNIGSFAYENASTLYGYNDNEEHGAWNPFVGNGIDDLEIDRTQHPAVIERYVYDVESRNSIFYTDIDHTIVPDLDDIIQLKIRDKSTDTYTEKEGYVLSNYSGENTPFQSATFDNTKEIICMATAAFSNVFSMDEYHNASYTSVTRKQFQAYCYAMWLESHYIDLANVESANAGFFKSWWERIKGEDDTPELITMLKENVDSYGLGGIVPFGHLEEYSVENRRVNVIAPINKFRYSPELYHYGDYVVDGDGLLAESASDNENLYRNHVPNAVDVGTIKEKTQIPSLSATVPTTYYNTSVAATSQKRITASKLSILNYTDASASTKTPFTELSASVGSVELRNYIVSASTYNFRYFGDKTHLIKDSDGSTENTPNSFVYNTEIWIDRATPYYVGADNLLNGFDDEYQDGQIVFSNAGDPSPSNIESETLIGGSNALNSSITTDMLVGYANEFDDTSKTFLQTEENMKKLFYNRFNTNPGKDEDESNLYSVPKIKKIDGSTEDMNWVNSYVTDCGVQEAYSGSVLLNSINSTDYPIKGDKSVIANVLSETNLYTGIFTRTDIISDPVKYFYNPTSTQYQIPTILSSVQFTNGTTTNGNNIPYVVITSKTASDFNAAKALIPDSLRCILIYIDYSKHAEITNYTCSDGCEKTPDCHCGHLEGDPCTCTDLYCHCGIGNTCSDCTELNKHGSVQYRVQVSAHIPTAEFTGFYLCGGHTQVVVMPVVLSFQGSRTLFDISFDDGDGHGSKLAEVCGLTKSDSWLGRPSYIGQHTEDLTQIWDTSDADLAGIAKQNRMNAVEALTDNWEDKYDFNYNDLKQRSDEVVEDDSKLKELNPNPSYLRPSNHKDDDSILTKYKIAGTVAFDPSAKFVSSKDNKWMEAVISYELSKTLDKNDTPPDGELRNEYNSRLARCIRAISKVGKVGYSQACHNWSSLSMPVVDGNDLFYKTDCSGYAAWVIGEYLSPGLDDNGERLPAIWTQNLTSNAGDISGAYTITSTEGDTKSWNTSTNFDDLKPGDLAFTDGHVVVYICTVYPEDEAYWEMFPGFVPEEGVTYAPYVFIAECTSVGGKLGPGGVQLSAKTKSDFKSTYTKYLLVDYDVYPEEIKEEPSVLGVH